LAQKKPIRRRREREGAFPSREQAVEGNSPKCLPVVRQVSEERNGQTFACINFPAVLSQLFFLFKQPMKM
jgi:hypothetical protein